MGNHLNLIYREYGNSVIRVESAEEFAALCPLLGDGFDINKRNFYRQAKNFPLYFGISGTSYFGWMPIEWTEHDEIKPGYKYYTDELGGYKYLGEAADILEEFGIFIKAVTAPVDTSIL